MIEKACFNDAEEILSVINSSNREAYGSIIPKEHFKDSVLSFEGLLKDFERMTFYVYKSEGRIVGVAALEIENEETGRIRWVYILSAYQRRGIGTALVRHLEGISRERGLRRLRLLVIEKAEWAANFYKQLGYSFAEKRKNPWGGFDTFMRKDLEERNKR